jgi:hypothetical protein
MGDAPAADGAGGGTRRQFDVDEPLNGVCNGLHLIFVVFAASQLAAREGRTANVFHDNEPTPRAQEDDVDLGDADDALKAGVDDVGDVSLREALTRVTSPPYFVQNRGLPLTSMWMPLLPKPVSVHALAMSARSGRSSGRTFAKYSTASPARARTHESRSTGEEGSRK